MAKTYGVWCHNPNYPDWAPGTSRGMSKADATKRVADLARNAEHDKRMCPGPHEVKELPDGKT